MKTVNYRSFVLLMSLLLFRIATVHAAITNNIETRAECDFDLGEDFTICEGESVTLTAPVAPGNTYLWSNGSTTPSITVVPITATTYSVTVTTADMCEASDAITIHVNPSPVFNIGADIEDCVGEPKLISGPYNSNYQYQWYLNDVIQSNTSSALSVNMPVQQTEVKLVVTNIVNGCSFSDDLLLKPYNTPMVDLGGDVSACVGELVSLSGSTGTGFSYKWFVNNQLQSTSREYAFIATTQLIVTLEVTGPAPHYCVGSDAVTVYMLESPAFDLGDDITVCENETVTLSGPTGMAYYYQWFVNNQLINAATGANYNYMATEDAWVKLEVTPLSGCVSADSIFIQIQEAPVVDLPQTLSGCTGSDIVLQGPVGTDYAYQWYVNDNLHQIGASSFIINTETPDVLHVRLVVSAPNGCTDEGQCVVTIVQAPYFAFDEEEVDACIGSMITFTGPTGSDLNYNWFVNDQQYATTPSIDLLIESNTSEVKLEITTTLNGCSVSDSIAIIPHEVPSVTLPDDMQVCYGYLVSLESIEEEGFTYQWIVGGEIHSNETSVLNIIITENTNIVLNVSTENGCQASDEISITVLPSPQIEVIPDSVGLCFGSSIEISYTGMYGETYTWFDGSTEQSFIFEPAVIDTVYYLWAEAVHYNGCTARDTAVIRVLKDVDVDLLSTSGYNGVCIGESIEIKATTTGCFDGEFVVWDNVDTVYFNGQTSLTRMYTPQTNMWAKAKIVSDDGCFEKDSLFITVVQQPVITFLDAPSTICQGNAVTLQAQGAFYYTWYANGQPVAEGHRVTLTPTETTTYEIVGQSADPFLCEGAGEITITVLPLPVVEITSNYDPICDGTDVVLTASGAETYQWNTGSSWYQVYIHATETTLFEVIGTNAAGCTDTTTFLMEVLPAIEASFTGILPVYCLNDVESPLTGTPKGGNFYGPGITDTIFNPVLAGAGTHTINYIFMNENGCQTGQSITTRVFGETITIDIGEDQILCPGDDLIIDPIEDFDKYYWSTGDTTKILKKVLGSEYKAGEMYEISLIGVLRGCTAYGSMSLIIDDNCSPGFEDHFMNRQLSIVPNPTKGIVTIATNENDPILAIEIYDIRGSKVLSQEIDEGSYSRILDLSNERNKLLIIRALTKDHIYFGKLIVE